MLHFAIILYALHNRRSALKLLLMFIYMAYPSGRSLAGIAGSITAGGVDVYPLLLYVVLFSAEALQGVLQSACRGNKCVTEKAWALQ